MLSVVKNENLIVILILIMNLIVNLIVGSLASASGSSAAGRKKGRGKSKIFFYPNNTGYTLLVYIYKVKVPFFVLGKLSNHCTNGGHPPLIRKLMVLSVFMSSFRF